MKKWFNYLLNVIWNVRLNKFKTGTSFYINIIYLLKLNIHTII